ncbi:hypothetical protein BJX64DRAFT_52838 [Aspergillus heterothallicus]
MPDVMSPSQSLSSVPLLLAVEIDDRGVCEYKLLLDGSIKYITVAEGTFAKPRLSIPISTILPPLVDDDGEEDWNCALIRRDELTGKLGTIRILQTLVGVNRLWHPVSFNVFDLKLTKQLTRATFEAVHKATLQTAIAKIAKFGWEIIDIDVETRTYQRLEGTELAPRFLGHVHEEGRVVGFLLENVPGRPATIEDFDICRETVLKFHRFGLVHGDLNRFNFIVHQGKAMLIDFTMSTECHDRLEAMDAELEGLRGRLME